jgi:DNA-binding CsgD family transcriptional regulator
VEGNHSDCSECRRSSEIAALALAAPSQRDFHREVLRRFIEWSGGDSGLIHQHVPSTAPFETGVFEEMDMHYAGRCVSNWDEQYGQDMAWVVRASIEMGGVAIDARSLGKRSQLAFYADIVGPTRVREGMFCSVELGGRPLSMCLLNRSSRSRVLEDSVATVRQLLPVFTLGDRVLSKRTMKLDEEAPIAGLSRRERQVTELITLGYTNPEIAMALGSSIHTVRNQVASIFRKAGASTRAELVGIVRRHSLVAQQASDRMR